MKAAIEMEKGHFDCGSKVNTRVLPHMCFVS